MLTNELKDLAFVVPDDLEIALPLTPAGQFFICLEGGISTRLYFKLVRLQDDLSAAKTDRQAIQVFKEIMLAVIREDPAHSDITMAFINDHINNVSVLSNAVKSIYAALMEATSQPGLRLPDIKMPPTHSTGPVLPTEDNAGIMRDIAFVCTHTAHTYADIMAMPYVTYLALLNNLVLSEALKDPDYRKAYELAIKREALKNGTIKRQKLDYEGLKRFAANLVSQ